MLAAAHDVGTDALTRDAVLYDVTAPDGSRLLYATDTGPLPDTTVAALAGSAFDLVLVEETFGAYLDHGTGHLDLASLPGELRRLREVGAVNDATDVVAVHLSHHNPPGPELARVLAPWGVRTVDDLTEIEVGPASGVVGPSLPRRTLLLGGARSGKSHEAERMLAATADVAYVATSGTRADDEEWAARVELHRARARSVDDHRDARRREAGALPRAGRAGRLPRALARRACSTPPASGPPSRATAQRDSSLAEVEREVAALVDAVRRTTRTLVLVRNEVGSGVVPAHASGRLYRDLLGRLNARVAAECDAVSLVVAGTVLPLKPGSSAAAP